MAITPPILDDEQRQFLSTPQPLLETLQDTQDRAEFSGFTIVRLAPDVPIEDIPDLRELADIFGLEGLQTLLAEEPDIITERLIQTISLDALLRLEQQVAAANRPHKFSLASFWRLDTRQFSPDQRKELINRLEELPEVGEATAELATYNPDMAPLQSTQIYRIFDPYGINLDGPWGLLSKAVPNSQGEGIQLVDIEQGWVFEHRELAGRIDSTPITGENNEGDLNALDHGTSVLGIICGQDASSGIIGIAPEAEVRVASHYGEFSKTGGKTGGNVAAAIVAALEEMNPGDILLLEAEEGLGYPTEKQHWNRLAIEKAVKLGIIVIEAAGNGNFNLDSEPGFEPGTPSSGAIMVAASMLDSHNHPRAYNSTTRRGSNYGDRIDCFAQGSGVVTAAGKTGGPGSEVRSTEACTSTFDGTSSAAAIIAGAALVIQSMHMEKQRLLDPSVPPTPLSPDQMRTLLSSASGTESISNMAFPPEPIKYMPNLKRIAEDLAICPVPVFLSLTGSFCDHPGEDPIGLGADILTSIEKVERPTVLFGDRTQFGDGFLALSTVVAGQENFIYIRIRNRGGIPAENLIARVYAAPFSSLITPEQLILVGKSAPITVPIGCNPVITQPIAWRPQQTIGKGYTLIAELVSAQSEQQPLSQLSWPEFLFTLCNSEQVAQRSIQVVDLEKSGSTDIELPFLITGTPDGRPFNLEIRQQLPEGVEVQLEVPQEVFEAIAQNTCIDEKDIVFLSNNGQTRLRLPNFTQVSFPRVQLPKGESYPSKILVPRKSILTTGRYSIAACQHAQGNELGRVTFVLR